MYGSGRTSSQYNWWPVLGSVIAIHLIINLALPHLPVVPGLIKSYVFQPLLWGVLIWVILKVLPGYRPLARLSVKSAIIQLALMIGFFQIVLDVIGGLFSGFGKSPYSFTPLGIFTNLIFVGSALIGMELSRAWLINYMGRRHTFLALAFIAFIYTVISIPLAQSTGISLKIETVTFLNSTLMPLLAQSLLATYLALLAGPLASIAYRGTLQAFWWFCPILPDMEWVFKGLFGIVVPIIGLIAVQTYYSSQIRRGKARRETESGLAGWIITTIAAVVIIWFAVGLFPLHPALVGSGSMSPAMNVGDVVIVAKLPADVVKVGDESSSEKRKGLP